MRVKSKFVLYIKFLLIIIQLIGENKWVAEKLYKFFCLPKPIISFEYKLATGNSENNFCHLRFNKITGKLCWFFRIRISNSGKIPIKNCDVRLEKIEKKGKSGFTKVSGFSPIFLHWANDQTDASRDIHHDMDNYLDIVYTTNGQNLFFIFSKKKHIRAGSRLTWPVGEYRFYIKIIGDNIIPKDRVIYIDFNGQWNQLKMDLSSK